MTKTKKGLRIQQSWLKAPALQSVLSVLNERGTTRIAGGAVRNALLGQPVADVDLATTLTPQEVTLAAQNAGLGVHPTGIEHGTVTVVAEGKPFEVTTLRVDVETYGRRAKVTFTDDWSADASRRDFTMNALYCDARGEVHDPLGGYDDLRKRLVRFVGKPEQRIREDYLRILRFFRFNAQYGQGAPERSGLKQCVRLRQRLASLSGERIRQELWKLLAAPGARRMLKAMNETGITRVLLGKALDLKSFSRMEAVDKTLKVAPDPLLRLELIGGNAEKYRNTLKLTNAEMARLKSLKHAAAPKPELRAKERKVVLYQLGKQAYSDSIRLAWARSTAPVSDRGWKSLWLFGRKTELPRFPVTGDDLKLLGIDAGPQMGAILRMLEDWWTAAGFPEDKGAVLRRLEAMGGLPAVAGSAHKDGVTTADGVEER
jgi:poly(A) polymerase